jgi:catechol 2,3-dioxygenase-like lactoylglutathione lyase family enzyme
MLQFKSPMINLYSRDLPRAVAFYSDLGFVEVSVLRFQVSRFT